MRCAVAGCDSAGRMNRGLCWKHYTRLRRHGDVHAVKRAVNGAGLAFLRAVAARPHSDECIEWPFGRAERAGYGSVLNKRRAHVVMLEIVTGEAAGGRLALHSCDNPPCVNPAHLRWGTPKDNAQDASLRGRCRNQWTGRAS